MLHLMAVGALSAAYWEVRHKQIRRHYLRTWFGLDFFSVAVSLFDIISLAAGSEELDKLAVLRVVRVLRLVKLLRLLRGMRLLKRWETRVSVDYGLLTLSAHRAAPRLAPPAPVRRLCPPPSPAAHLPPPARAAHPSPYFP